jgi:hypothetical protein
MFLKCSVFFAVHPQRGVKHRVGLPCSPARAIPSVHGRTLRCVDADTRLAGSALIFASD